MAYRQRSRTQPIPSVCPLRPRPSVAARSGCHEQRRNLQQIRTLTQLSAAWALSREARGDARITDLHVSRVGPGAHAVIVSVTGGGDGETVRSRLAPVRELAHVTVETR